MSSSTNRRHRNTLDRTDSGLVLQAGLTLRFGVARLHARVYWPQPTAEPAACPLILLLTDAEAAGGIESGEGFGRLLCSAAAAIVLAVPAPGVASPVEGPDHDRQIAVLGWVADHAAELGGHPHRLLVAGRRVAGARAARLAISAQHAGWPELARQMLVHPQFSAELPIPSPLAGVAPATVVTGDPPTDDGSRYAARLRASGTKVDELYHPYAAARRPELRALMLADLARSLGALAPAGRGSVSGDERRARDWSYVQNPERKESRDERAE
jgi:acetyl esterase/lipase